jgi:hypothetical protein
MGRDRGRVRRAGDGKAGHEGRARGRVAWPAFARGAANHHVSPCRFVGGAQQPLVAPDGLPAARAAAKELLADLAQARRAERVAVSLLAEVRDELAATVISARSMRIGYDRMAQATLRAVRSPTVTLLERQREAARLRKLVHRNRRVTARHAFERSARGTSPGSSPPSMGTTGGRTMSQKLISRKTIEERFIETDEDERLDEADDLEGEDEREENEPEPPHAARPRR